MIGVGTAKANLMSTLYCSLLGQDRESWGLSYKGYLQHNGERRDYSSGFNKDSVVRIHLDTWKGSLQFFIDNKPIGKPSINDLTYFLILEQFLVFSTII